MMDHCLHYVLNDKHEPIPEPDFNKWALSFTDGKKRRVDETIFIDSHISTVFLGLDHNYFDDGDPVLFETMVFGGPMDGKQIRFCTWNQSQRGHNFIKYLLLMYYAKLGGGKWRRAKKLIDNGWQYNKRGREFYSHLKKFVR